MSVTAAQHVGSGGDVASTAVRKQLERTLKKAAAMKRKDFAAVSHWYVRRFCLQGWILPLLIASSEGERQGMLKLLDQWLEICAGGPAAFLACVAQGFKYEANRVLRRGEDRAAREHLVTHALALIEETDYWFTRMTLLQTMTLWMLAEGGRASKNQQRWLTYRASVYEHPFVSAATDLCSRALATRNPSPFIWIDETGIVAKLGQQSATVDLDEAPLLWLTDSVGWVALKPRAARLVADALLMLNLTDGSHPGNGTGMQFDRMRQACRPTLPPCMVRQGQRANLSVLKAEDERPWVLPSTTCDGSCQFHLCPYPQTGRTSTSRFQRVVLPAARNDERSVGMAQDEVTRATRVLARNGTSSS